MNATTRARLLSVEEVTAALSLSRRSVERLIKIGLLKSICIGRRRLIDERDLAELIGKLKEQQ